VFTYVKNVVNAKLLAARENEAGLVINAA